MGLFRRLLGDSQPSPVTWDRTLAAMGQSASLLENTLGTFTTGQAALIVSHGDQTSFTSFVESIQVGIGKNFHVIGDDQNHAWVIARTLGLNNLAGSLQFAVDKLIETGFENQILAAVFPFEWTDRVIYWICRGRSLKFTPFALDGRAEPPLRDFTLEQRMEKACRKLFPTDRNVRNWFPLWNMPI